mgnify:CR=1 FL=1|jgi:radical SAM superfamily enzyme YgiQ (UPF0313 family)
MPISVAIQTDNALMPIQQPHKPQNAVETAEVVLTTLNAKYIHASLGLRYLLANMARHGSDELQARTVIREFTIQRPLNEVVKELLALKPRIIGLGVYIWNVTQTTELVRLLKAQAPEVKLVLGGPEVSHEWEQQEVVALADHVITGWGDVSFPKLCLALLQGPRPLMKVIAGVQPPLDEIALPYAQYSDADLAHRVLYVEASRGCPFKCEFCLSSLDKTAWAFDLDVFLRELDDLYARGARTFKFVDRTFNLKAAASARILQFFLDKLALDPVLFVHFELIPDQLPDRLKDLIAQFPAGVLQFEIGIQSFNPEVQQRISRRQDDAATVANLTWLLSSSQAHLHTDLIFGLPGESLESFAAGFDKLYALEPHEIQLGILKRLRGTPIARHTESHAMVYDAQPPYAVISTDVVDTETLTQFTRLASYWDRIANSGRFTRSLPLLLATHTSPFKAFWHFSVWLWARQGSSHSLSPEQLVDALFDYLQGAGDVEMIRQALLADYLASGARARPLCLSEVLPHIPAQARDPSLGKRQARHQRAPEHQAS